jgi:hypothetical protein
MHLCNIIQPIQNFLTIQLIPGKEYACIYNVISETIYDGNEKSRERGN